jgi:membrane-associated phospholipid phosphatase
MAVLGERRSYRDCGQQWSNVKQLPTAIGIWLLSFVACVAAVILSFEYADLAIASYHPHLAAHLSTLGDDFGGSIILSGEAIVLACLAVVRLVNGRLPPIAEALALACLASICAYTIDSEVLKVYFGVPNPYQMTRGAKHTLNLWEGSPYSSFPSGHMALAGAFAGVFMRLYRTSIWALSLALLLSCILLIIGGWHFLSDVIAGTYFGVSVGLAVAETLGLHFKEGRTTDASL